MLRSWKLGKAFGIGIYVHSTFLLLVAFVLYNSWQATASYEMVLYALGLLLSVFGCVILHELGHAVTARRFGIATRDITLYPIGGVARLERMSEKPWEEFWIAVAGPAVNVVIAAVLGVLLVVVASFRVDSVNMLPDFLRENFVVHLAAINVLLVLFNLLPAFPMDGGRVLRAMLIWPLGRLRATQLAAGLGAVFAALFLAWAIDVPKFRSDAQQPTLMLVGAFLFLAGRMELAAVRREELRRQTQSAGASQSEDEVEVIASPLHPQFTGTTWDEKTRVCIVWRNGWPIHTYYAE